MVRLKRPMYKTQCQSEQVSVCVMRWGSSGYWLEVADSLRASVVSYICLLK